MRTNSSLVSSLMLYAYVCGSITTSKLSVPKSLSRFTVSAMRATSFNWTLLETTNARSKMVSIEHVTEETAWRSLRGFIPERRSRGPFASYPLLS